MSGGGGEFGTVGAGRYRLIQRIGRGGMAEVFAAEDVRLGRPVAVKLLRADLAQDTVARQRFTREAQSVAGLNHHAIVGVYDTGEDMVNGEPLPFMVMELVEGRTIRDLLIDAEEPPVEQALIVASGVLEALGYSHRMGIVHRDIKPANVIITNQGAVKVMDFGIARALGGGASTMTQTGMVMGTPQYLSPEQALGKGVDARSDLYATGCLLYELLTLRPPFTGETPLSVVYQHVQDPPVPPSQANPRVPPELDGLVLRSLAKDPDERFQSADEFRGAIQHALVALTGTGSTQLATGMYGVAGMAAAPTQRMDPAYGGATPYAGTPGVGATQPTTAMGGAGGPGAPVELDGADGGGPRRSRKALVAAIVVIAAIAAIAIGVWAATNNSGGGGGGGTTQSPTQSATTSSSSTPSHTSSPTQSPTSSSTQSETPSYTPTHSSSPTQSTQPTPTSSPTKTSGGGGTGTSSPKPTVSHTSGGGGSAPPSPTGGSTETPLTGG
ncbi:serine/threonine protein kinase [Mangrovactinospora gilvigrisea]|uniref:non-specific serine/threonine protein kinase n=2 Tax=Mangrovactinospora gilvigrisea TaxID=1428644 RepID=A0A1J7BHR8_9ACTN|nr:protein kinase [Mangrovactinospora gilvigrisea]OIV38198.1 serine/threonine protein kinase [Mangrovactinospora gilvigrisea]